MHGWISMPLGAMVCLLFSVSGMITLPAAASEERAPRSYREIQKHLRELSAKFPGNAEVIEMGQSDSGQPIEALKVGHGPVAHLVVATHHGNEYGSTEVAKAFAASIAEAPIGGQTIYVIPVLNISGYNTGSRREVSPAYGSVDPNRDYPGPCGTLSPFKLKSTAALAKFMGEKKIVTSATLHTYSPAVVYPWGMGATDVSTPYDDFFRMLAKAATVESHYTVGNSAEVIYPANGTFEDYAFWKYGSWALLFELGRSHSPSDSAVQEMVRVNVPGLRRMMEQSPNLPAERHEFSGTCSARLAALDREDE